MLTNYQISFNDRVPHTRNFSVSLLSRHMSIERIMANFFPHTGVRGIRVKRRKKVSFERDFSA
jgi:hypothetical protein